MIYLDHAATTPMSPSAIDAYRQAAERFFGNASSLHDIGSEAERALEGARRSIAGLAGVSERGLHITGCGSEASFLALTTLARSRRKKGTHLITSEIEHSSVRNTFSWLEEQGFEVTRLRASQEGRIDPAELERHLRGDTILVSIQHVNSEIGTIQPLEEIGSLLEGHQAFFHSDLVQSFGKLDLSAERFRLDSFTISGHKIRGPKGIGTAWIDPAVSWSPFIHSTIHERGFRPGTVDVPGVVAFAVAAREAQRDLEENIQKASRQKQLLLQLLKEHLPEDHIAEGTPETTSPYILGLRIRGMEGQYAMLECSQKGLAISTGSACQVNEQKPSATLLSMGRNPESAKQFIRLSFGPETGQEEISRASEIIAAVVSRYRSRAGLSTL